MSAGVVNLDGLPKPAPSRDKLSAGKPLGWVSRSTERQVSFAYRSSVDRSSSVSALAIPGADARRVDADPSCSPRSNTPRTAKL